MISRKSSSKESKHGEGRRSPSLSFPSPRPHGRQEEEGKEEEEDDCFVIYFEKYVILCANYHACYSHTPGSLTDTAKLQVKLIKGCLQSNLHAVAETCLRLGRQVCPMIR